MAVMRLKGLNKVTVTLASGKRVTYWYAWKGGPRLDGQPGTPEFVASFNRAVAARKTPKRDNLASLVGQFRSSPEFARMADSTQAEWGRWLARIEIATIGSLPIAALNDRAVKDDLMGWRDSYADRPRTADYGAQVLARVLSWGMSRGKLTFNAMDGAGTLYRADRADMIWTEDDLSAFAEKASVEVAKALRLACLTGLRRSDLIALQWRHIGETAIVFSTAKSRKTVTVTIPLLDETRELLGKRGEGHVLLNSRGKPWTADGLENRIWTAKKAAGIDLHLHDARGTFATRLRLAGLTKDEIASVMGWDGEKVERIIARYVDQARIVRSIADRLNKAGSQTPK